MKRTIIVLLVVLAAMLIIAGLAYADGGPHGGYTPTTDACAGCHRAHTAVGPQLLVATTTHALCMSCHGSGGTGANTNVDDGIYLSSRDDAPGGANGNVGAANTPDNAPLLGGGFVNYEGVAVTSKHDVSGGVSVAWGNNANRGAMGALVDGEMTCASCHDPHGSSNYRIFKETINGTSVVVAQVDEDAAKDYDTEQWGSGASNVCAACHGAYHVTTPGSGSNPAYVASGGYTHAIDMPYNYDGNNNPETTGIGGFTVPLAETGSGDLVVCGTCHMAHGTAAAMTGFAHPSFNPSGPQGPVPAGSSSLLRLDNRGVCEVCHQK